MRHLTFVRVLLVENAMLIYLSFRFYSLFSPFINVSSPALFLFYRQAMIDEFDLDQDGEISEQEFLAIMLDGE